MKFCHSTLMFYTTAVSHFNLSSLAAILNIFTMLCFSWYIFAKKVYACCRIGSFCYLTAYYSSFSGGGLFLCVNCVYRKLQSGNSAVESGLIVHVHFK